MIGSLRVELAPIDADWVKLRFWLPGAKQPETCDLPLAEIQPLIDHGEAFYFTRRPDLKAVGQQLFTWLDGSGRWLSRAIQACPPPALMLAIDVNERLAHLPWEVLHDGQGFLVARPGVPVVPVRWQPKSPAVAEPPGDQTLQVLFMATAPEGVEPPLAFEQEEAEILKASEELPLTLRVEESGCIEELGKLWRKYSEGTFDVFHLTGHATLTNNQPVFITETATGERYDASASEIVATFRGRLPRLVFLSGCRTAQAGNEGSVASMAATLVTQGIPAVLGWGQPVLDTSATQAAAQLYQGLAEGFSVIEALGITYRALIQDNIPDWHLLRLHACDTGGQALIEPPEEYIPPLETVQDQFLDPEGRVRVAGPDEFVGRRRVLQRSLKALTQTRGCIGVMLHGLGGNGKSTLAARLLERLPGYTPIVMYRHLDETELTGRLSAQCESTVGLEILNGQLPLPQRLSKFLREGLNDANQRFCFVLDDFEANLEATTDGNQVLVESVVPVMNALLTAIVQSGKPHRVVITSRYNVTLPQQNQRIERQMVTALSQADLVKKYDRLASFQRQSAVAVELQDKAKAAANGNPRLLEWLDKVLQDEQVDAEQIVERMAAEELRFREDILAEALLSQQVLALQQLLARGLTYEIPVPAAAMEAIWKDLPDWQTHQQRAIALGLLEEIVGTNHQSLYRVPRLLRELLPAVDQDEYLQTAANTLYDLWWEGEEKQPTEVQGLELYRLLQAAGCSAKAADVGHALATRWRDKGRYREAITVYEGIINLRRQGKDSDDHPSVATSLNNLAGLYDNQGRYSEAEPLYIDALALRKRLLGDDHPAVASSLNNLAGLYKNQGRYSEAG